MSDEMRAFISGILRDMEGNAVLSLATGRADPPKDAPPGTLGKLKIEEHHWFAYPAELDLMVKFADDAKAAKRDAYLAPHIYGDQPFVDKKSNVIPLDRHRRPLYSRAKTNALFAQTIYLDSDSCPPDAFRLPPSRHVDTSEGHGHDYWFLAEIVPASVAARIAHKITTAHKDDGSDPSAWSANKLLRLPTWNTSYDPDNPYEVTWADSVEAAGGEVYLDSDIEGVYDDIDVDSTDYGSVEYAPPPPLEGLPAFEDLVQRIPRTERRLNDLIYKQPKTGPDGWRSEQRYALLADLQRYGFTDEETIAIAWHSPAAAKFREESRGVNGLWWELQVKVKPMLEGERGGAYEPASIVPEAFGGPKLLTAAERMRVENRTDLMTLYLTYARSRVAVFNAPYHHINGWLLLSIALGDTAIIPKDPKPLPLNLSAFTIGGSSTGKTESEALKSQIIVYLFPHDPIHVAGRSSKESLIETLIERDGRVTTMSEDEGHGLLMEMKAGGSMVGVQQIWTKVYDGDVPSLGRVGRKELNKVGRTTVFVFDLRGTWDGMLRAIDKSMYYEGFMPRQIIAIGEESEVTEETMRTKFQSDTIVADGMPRWWASHLTQIRERIRKQASLDATRTAIMPTDEAHARLDKAKWEISQFFAKHHDPELWKTIVNRMGDIMWKMAALEALSQGRIIMGLRDVEVAIAYAETWVSNAIQVATRISDTYFSKQTDDIERYIASQPSRECTAAAVYRFRKGEEIRITDTYLNSLIKQGRIEENPVNHYRIKGATA